MSGLETTGAHTVPNTCPFQCQSLAECRRRPECEGDQRRSLVIEGIRQFGLAPDGSDLRDLEMQITRLTARVAELEGATNWPRGTRIRVEHDGFEGVVLNPYTTLEGKRGQVCQLNGARVVHVYGEKWLTKLDDDALAHPEKD